MQQRHAMTQQNFLNAPCRCKKKICNSATWSCNRATLSRNSATQSLHISECQIFTITTGMPLPNCDRFASAPHAWNHILTQTTAASSSITHTFPVTQLVTKSSDYTRLLPLRQHAACMTSSSFFWFSSSMLPYMRLRLQATKLLTAISPDKIQPICFRVDQKKKKKKNQDRGTSADCSLDRNGESGLCPDKR